nr:Conserved domain protein precursor [Kibdelosporangium sp. MJ126-NF4]CTQ98451.1 Conserved domain protein precursor [Kibdelosporangium sp. MJ126-NF4]
MRLLRYLVVLLLIVSSVAATPVAAGQSTKKGVSAANVAGVTSALADSRVGWYYNWASSTQGIVAPSGVEFVPMIWGANSVTDTELNQAKASGTTLLGFNEPDLLGQALMTVERALELWPRLQQTGMRLGAPAVAWGGDIPGGWLDRFMSGAAQRGLRVDFIPLHWYGSDFSAAATGHLKKYIQSVYDRYRKPIWLTEFGLINFSGPSPTYPNQAEQAAFARDSTAMLEGLSFVQRYSWFTLSTATSPTGLYNGTTANETGVAYRDATGPIEHKAEPKKDDPPGLEETVKGIYDIFGVDSPPGPAGEGPGNNTVTFVNQSGETVWLGSTVNADGSANLTGLPTLQNGQSATITIPESSAPNHWRGKFFARQGCTGESGSTFHCKVGDCGVYADRCSTGDQPVSLAEFNFDRKDALAVWYNVSYVNAFSLPITIAPRDAKAPPGSKECEVMGCSKNLLTSCPPENLTRGDDGSPMLCTNPNRDAKTPYSNAIQSACPQAYAWSKQDAEPGNETVRQCKECSGFTVTFHSGR